MFDHVFTLLLPDSLPSLPTQLCDFCCCCCFCFIPPKPICEIQVFVGTTPSIQLYYSWFTRAYTFWENSRFLFQQLTIINKSSVKDETLCSHLSKMEFLPGLSLCRLCWCYYNHHTFTCLVVRLCPENIFPCWYLLPIAYILYPYSFPQWFLSHGIGNGIWKYLIHIYW